MDRRPATRLDPETPFLNDARAQALCKVLESAGYTALFVGGCVRNALLNAPASDIDIATDALPQDVIAVVEHAGYRAVPTGIDHGTVTVVIDDHGFEVTTFRKDVETDGRRAVVAFSKDIGDDALRRDFTMNAIYADRFGAIVDPLGGLPDVYAGRVRFIEDAGQRIREDYLRTLRFFRFHAYYAQPDAGWDADALAGIADNLDGLDTLSAERVGAEMLKLLSAPDPSAAVSIMAQTGVLARVLPGSDPTLLGPVVHVGQMLGTPPDALARLAALGGQDVATRLRLSRAQSAQLDRIREHSVSTHSPKALGFLVGAASATGAILLRAAMANAVPDPQSISHVSEGAAAQFPIKASDLPDLQGRALGEKLAALKADWLASDLRKSKNELLGT